MPDSLGFIISLIFHLRIRISTLAYNKTTTTNIHLGHSPWARIWWGSTPLSQGPSKNMTSQPLPLLPLNGARVVAMTRASRFPSAASFIPHNCLKKQIMLFPFYRWGLKDSEGLGNLPQVTWLVGSEAGIKPRSSWNNTWLLPPHHCSSPLPGSLVK